MNPIHWIPLSRESAPDGVPVHTKIDDENGPRNEQVMTRRGNLWFAGDMYVYYRPTHWARITLD